MWLCGLVFKLFLSNTLAYNLDINNVNVFSVPKRLQSGRNSYFGYATALYTSSKNVSAVLIGSPRANTSSLPSVLEPGTVYVCPINNECKEWIIDKSENNKNALQVRNNSWIGAVVLTENRVDPRIMVCAPRWIKLWFTTWMMNGMCYYTKTTGMESFNKEAENSIFPISQNNLQVKYFYDANRHYYGLGQVGFSARMTSYESHWDVALGAPGVLFSIGTTVLLKITDSDTKTIIPQVTLSDDSIYDYFGYSTTSGCYFKKHEYLFASGSPRCDHMNGCVIIYKFPDKSREKLQIETTIKGEGYAEYFGATLASCDLNGDDKDELIVGAPFWSRDVDEGRVYIFIAQKNNFETQIIEGEISEGRFGSTITCLGDIDYDGYGDIVIGAPYEGDSGAIYLYNGNKHGIFKKYSQKILGSQFSRSIRGFGISISEPQDINGDKYPDIAVGAYLSEQVVLLTSIPVVSITVSLVHSIKKLLRDTKSFDISICTLYNGEHAPEELDIVRILEVDSLYGRAAYTKGKSNNSIYILPVKLNIREKQCDKLTINFEDNIQNVIDPISISVVVDLDHTVQEKQQKLRNNISHTLAAVVNKLRSQTEHFIELSFAIGCGEDNICNSDLQISVLTNLKSNNTYILGSESNFELTINVHNSGEPAYQSQVNIIIPHPLKLESIPPKCMESTSINNPLQVVCNIGNPLLTNETANLILNLDTEDVRFNVKNLELYANVTTQSEEENQLDNNYNMTVYFDIDVDIAIAGKAEEDLYSYFQKVEKDENYPQNIRFKHIYEVQKFGTSPIDEAVLMVEVPTHWKNKELISINSTIVSMDHNLHNCIVMDQSKISPTTTVETIKESNIKNILIESLTRNEVKDKLQEKHGIEETIPTNVPPENRTLFINCTNPMIMCKQLKCKLNTFTSSSSVAKIILTLDLKISNIQLLMLENKDIIFFASKGTVNITQPPNIIQGGTNKPDTTVIATTFVGAPVKEHVAGWILVLSICLGILLLILITLGLFKLGFFHRKKKEELETLKAMSNHKDPIVLQTSSSEDALNEDVILLGYHST